MKYEFIKCKEIPDIYKYGIGSVIDKATLVHYPAYYDNDGNLNVQINNGYGRAEDAAKAMHEWVKKHVADIVAVYKFIEENKE